MVEIFKLGPFAFDEGPDRSMYVAYAVTEGPRGMADACTDQAGIKALLKQLGGGEAVCEPELEEAARALGLKTAPLSNAVLATRADLTLTLAMGTDAAYPPELYRRFALASAAYWKARPWDTWYIEQPLKVQLSGAVRGWREAVIVGGAGREMGLALYDEPGTFERMQRDAVSPAMQLRIGATMLLFDEEPAFARRPLQEAHGLGLVPEPARTGHGGLETPDTDELLALTAVVKAVAQLRIDRLEAEASVAAGGRTVKAVVRAAAPLTEADLEEAEEPLPEPAPMVGPLTRAQSDAFDLKLLDSLPKSAVREAKRRFPVPEDELEEADLQLFIPYLVFLFRHEGRTALERAWARERTHWTPQERAYAEAQLRAYLSLWEVVEVRRGEGLTLRDALTGETREVIEHRGSVDAQPWWGMLARVVDFEGSSVVVGMYPQPLEPRDFAEVTKRVKKLLGKGPVTPERLRAEGTAELLMDAWDEAAVEVANRPPPVLANTDGELLELVRLRFSFAPSARAEVAEKLRALSGDEGQEEDGALVFVFEKAGNRMHPEWENTVVGRAFLGDAWLELEANSRKRATSLRQRVTRKLDKLVRFESREVLDQEELLEEALAAQEVPGEEEPATPEEARALRALALRHYRNWLDKPLPELKGKSPREAVRSAKGREKVLVMLKEIESDSTAMSPETRPDLSFLWTELGLER